MTEEGREAQSELVPAAAGEPDWVAASMRMALAELRLYFETAFDFTRGPVKFAAAWVSSARRALNPLAFLATSVAIYGVVKIIGERVSNSGAGSRPLWQEAALAVAPYISYALTGVLAHMLLRLLGSRRKLSSTVAMALYASAGPGFGAGLLITLVVVGARIALHVPLGVPFGAAGAPRWAMLAAMSMVLFAFAAFLVPLALALMGLHRIRRLKVLTALAGAIVATALLAGTLVQAGLKPISYTLLQPQLVFLWSRDAHGHRRLNFDLWF